MMHRIMLIDDEGSILNALRRMLNSKAGVELDAFSLTVETFQSCVLALQRAEEVPFSLVLSDYRMPGMNGVQVLTRIRSVQPLAVRLILSGFADMSALIAAINDAHIHAFLTKPWVDSELRAAIARGLIIHERLRDHEELADFGRVQQGTMSAGEQALRALEKRNPDLARVVWAPDGGVMLEP